MKKITILIALFVGTYFLSVLTRATLSERNAEKYAVTMMNSIASPWSATKIREFCSKRLCQTSSFTPEEMAEVSKSVLGDLKEIKGVKCEFQSGYEKDSPEIKLTWAICYMTARFDKKNAKLKIRLFDEADSSGLSFGLIGEGLRFNDFMEVTSIN